MLPFISARNWGHKKSMCDIPQICWLCLSATVTTKSTLLCTAQHASYARMMQSISAMDSLSRMPCSNECMRCIVFICCPVPESWAAMYCMRVGGHETVISSASWQIATKRMRTWDIRWGTTVSSWMTCAVGSTMIIMTIISSIVPAPSRCHPLQVDFHGLWPPQVVVSPPHISIPPPQAQSPVAPIEVDDSRWVPLPLPGEPNQPNTTGLDCPWFWCIQPWVSA